MNPAPSAPENTPNGTLADPEMLRQRAARCRFVLVETSHPGNVGSAARALKTMGFGDPGSLVLVRPREPAAQSHADAIAMASGADDVLASARVVDDIGAALAGASLAIALTARPREFGPRRIGPRVAAEEVATLLAAPDTSVAFVFGNERFGLPNEVVERCHVVTHIPANPAYASLNLSQGLGDDFTLKMGIARAYKAPSLYQTNPNYLLYSKGQGCYASSDGVGCYMMGNDDLKAETSINKEIGLEWKRDGWLAGVTWFRNDYRDKIEAGYAPIGHTSSGKVQTDIYQWENVPKAVVEGLEGSLNVPVSDTINWTNNITWMLQSKNKETGDRLSIIPEYTLNSTLSWQVHQDVSLQSTFTWYGKQQPKKYNYKGQPVTGSEKDEVSPYSIVGLSATWDVTKYVSLTGGVDNVFDKRHWRAGNAQTTGGATGTMYGAGAETYNESGRTWYMSVNTHF